VPVVISGMASATIGLRLLPYRDLPFSLTGGNLTSATRPATKEFPHPLLIISGARVPDDVMRGEETQLVGAAALDPAAGGDGVVILPGTHSKHVRVEGGSAVALKTYMTGEYFDLLSRHSILANSIDRDAVCEPSEATAAFAEGVARGARENILHASFKVRVAEISGERRPAAGFYFLSGLMTGAELAELRPADTGRVTLVGNARLTRNYTQAFKALHWPDAVRVVAGGLAVIAGQRVIATRAGLLN
jgi:2-dehydro-3-deoxygalactonokinase